MVDHFAQLLRTEPLASVCLSSSFRLNQQLLCILDSVTLSPNTVMCAVNSHRLNSLLTQCLPQRIKV
jgi:hypothetical protein